LESSKVVNCFDQESNKQPEKILKQKQHLLSHWFWLHPTFPCGLPFTYCIKLSLVSLIRD